MAGDSVMAKVADPEVIQAGGGQEPNEREHPPADEVTPAAAARRGRGKTWPGQRDDAGGPAAEAGPDPAGDDQPDAAQPEPGPAGTGPAAPGRAAAD